ncbi:MAG: CocE/NonD family hydrolase [Planctomycetes bacterium]|nr:CocE/NonD family hydrolase [Planctomycetota bacterium]
MHRLARVLGVCFVVASAHAQSTLPRELELAARYEKREVRIPMRDGARLFAAVYSPRDRSRAHPILMRRTPYSVRPYGDVAFPTALGPSRELEDDGYIFVLADVRGRYLSEGVFADMRPHRGAKRAPNEIDESSDTYDTIEWLLANVENHNGKVGMWGISYPGFYAAAGMIDAHPALVAVSPQAPIADWFFDDFHHHGAFFLADAFNFMSSFGRARPEPTTESAPGVVHGTPDGYEFFLELGPLSNVEARWFHGEVAFWKEFCAHPNCDEFWSSRNLLPHLRDVAPAVMTVGGWFDAEDLYGPLATYRAIEAQDRDAFNVLVMGPWRHGGWARDSGAQLGEVAFGSDTAQFYRERIERPFFERFLKGADFEPPPEAFVFETGANRWRRFDAWPPKVEPHALFLREGRALSFTAPPATSAPSSLAARAESAESSGPSASGSLEFDGYLSDPAHPVPYHERIQVRTPPEYMTDDQRFASRRPDVLHFETEPLDAPLTFAGPSLAELWIQTTGSDGDFVVKLIDVFPPETPNLPTTTPGKALGGYQMLVRSEVLRARFRDGYAEPKPLVPDASTRLAWPLQDVLHTFEKGHRIAVQIQSSWFPLVDRNPQTFVPNVFEAREQDFRAAWVRVERSSEHSSCLRVGVLADGASR